MADYQLTQTGDEVQDILDNSQTGKYFYNQTVATWSNDATYADYPKKGLITLTGVKGTDGVEVTFSNADATSGNYAPICNTVANGVEIWAKAQDNALVIPTIHITTGADVQLQGDDAYLPISGGNITGSLSVVGSPVLTEASFPLVTETVSGTTNASGILASSIATANKILIFAECAGYICLPFYGSSNIMAVRVEQQNGSALASTSVTVKFSYIEV